jgi:hypothetical protein
VAKSSCGWSPPLWVHHKIDPKQATILLLDCFQTTLQNNAIGVQDAQGSTMVCPMYLEVKVQYSLECLRSVHKEQTHTHTHTFSLSLSCGRAFDTCYYGLNFLLGSVFLEAQ